MYKCRFFYAFNSCRSLTYGYEVIYIVLWIGDCEMINKWCIQSSGSTIDHVAKLQEWNT